MMATKTKLRTKSCTMLSGVIIGVILSILFSVICVSGLAALALKERIAEKGIQCGVVITQVISTMLGAMLSGSLVTDKKALACMITSASYGAALLCITLLFFEGQFGSVWTGLAAVIFGGALTVVICSRQGRKSNMSSARRKRYSR